MTNVDESDRSFQPTIIFALMTKSDEQFAADIGFKENKENDQLIPGDGNELHSEETDAKLDVNGRKTIYQRYFSKMEAGSLRGSIIAMSSIALGTGCLALPQILDSLSVTFGIIIIIISGFAAYWSLALMLEASQTCKTYEYSRLVKETLGNRMAKFLDMVVLIYCFGILISYQVISI